MNYTTPDCKLFYTSKALTIPTDTGWIEDTAYGGQYSAPYQSQQPPYPNTNPYSVPQQSSGPFYSNQTSAQTTNQHQTSNRSQNGALSAQAAGGSQANASSTSYEEALMNALRAEAQAKEPISRNDNNNDPQEEQDDDDEDDNNNDPPEAGDGDEPIYQLPPPPEATYKNEVELEDALHAWTLQHGYELVRRASKRNASRQLYKRYYHCSKHGPDRKSGAGLRVHKKSARTGCPMSLAAVSVDPHDATGDWQIRHRKTYHNHPPEEAVKLAGHRRRARNGAVEQAVDGLFAMGTKVGDVLKFLQRTHPEGLFKRTDVANMKLKFVKHGTCTYHGEEPKPRGPDSARPAACTNCRTRKTRCDNVRPICEECAKSNTLCVYETPAPEDNSGQAEDDGDQTMADDSIAGPSNVSQVGSANYPAQAHKVLAALNSFQQEYVRPARLTLESSAVEVLASTTCGSGESYQAAIPRKFAYGGDWNNYQDAFLSAARKENTIEVLLGNKREPGKPAADVSVEDHNEYIKQLAIYNRRNDLLKTALRDTLSPGLWNRIKLHPSATEMWSSLEDLCMPRGSDQAYVRFTDLFNVSLATSGTIDLYINDMETKAHACNQMSQVHDSNRDPATLSQSTMEVNKRKAGGNGEVSEDLLCFLFLRGLGEQWQTMANNLCKKHNLAGFGSGDRVNFKELAKLVKQAMDHEAGGGNGGGTAKTSSATGSARAGGRAARPAV